MSKIKSVGHEIIDLNEEQLKAIMDLKNNIYLKGRPGTGKSEAILQRTVNILNKGYAKEREILLIVSKNINEIRLRNKLERTDIKWDRINIMTIKKFCVRLVRLEGTNKLKVSNNWSFVDDNDSVEILKGILKENEILKEINKSVESIYEGLKKDKLNNISDNEILNKYNEYLFKNNLLDYLDVLSYADTLLEEKDISDFYSKKYKYINIHKVSKMSFKEYKVLSKIFKNNNIMLVSDIVSEDKKIYSDFKEIYNHKVIEFTTNHRGTKRLVYLENEYTKMCLNNIGSIKSSKGEVGETIDIIKTKNLKSEAEFLVSNILKDKLTNKNLSHGIIASEALYGEQLKLYLDKYSKGSLTFSLSSDTNFVDNKKIKGILSFMNLLIDKHSDYHLENVINNFYNIEKKVLDKIKDNNINVKLSDFIDGSSIKYSDPFSRLIRYLKAENAVIIGVSRERIINKEEIIRLSCLKVDFRGDVIDSLDKIIYIGESSSLNEAILSMKEFLRFVSGHLIISENAAFSINTINKINDLLGLEKLNHKSYYDIREIAMRYLNLSDYSLDNILNKLNIKNSKKEVFKILDILNYFINNKIIKEKESRKDFIKTYIDDFLKIKEDLIFVRNILRKKLVKPLDILFLTIEVLKSPKVYLFDWDNGSRYKKVLKEFFIYFDSKNKSIQEDLVSILDICNIFGEESFEFVTKENVIPILTIDEAEGFHFDSVYITGATIENFKDINKYKLYSGITRSRKKISFTVPSEDVYGNSENMLEVLENLNGNNISISRY